MQKIDTWYKAEGYCPSEEYELASYLLFEAGVATLEELDPKAEGRTDFCFYTGDKAERDRKSNARNREQREKNRNFRRNV